MPADKTLEDLFLDTLKDIYFAEKHIVEALPKMSKAATAPELKTAFDNHLKETEGHVQRLERIFDLLGKPARGKTCDAILGIIKEGKEIIEEFDGTEALDAGLASSAQAVEHYEIARYGTLKAWARQLGKTDVVTLLQATEDEEIAADKKLTQIAVSDANRKAAA